MSNLNVAVSVFIGLVFSISSNAKDFEQCQQEDQSNYILQNQINSVPRDNANMLLRAAIVGIDNIITVYSSCLPDPRAQQLIEQSTIQKTQALANCRAISSYDNCLQPPFDEVEALNRQAAQNAAQATAEAEAEREREEIRDAVRQFTDALSEVIGSQSEAAPAAATCHAPAGGVCTAQ